MINTDTKEINAWLASIRKHGGKVTKEVIKSYVNNMAFRTRIETRKTMNFNFKNSSTKKFIDKGVYVEKAKSTSDESNITASVGSVGQPNTADLKKRRGWFLARQESGGKVQQWKTKSSEKRSVVSVPQNKKTPRLRGKSSGGRKGLTGKRNLASAIDTARKRGKRYAVSEYGVYLVLKRSARMIQSYRRNPVTTPKNPWLKPATTLALQHRNKMFREAMIFRLKKAGLIK